MKTWRKYTSTWARGKFSSRRNFNRETFYIYNVEIIFYRSLRRTTAEIQNYGFERLERATTSKDSGISNMADVEERMEGLTLSNSVSRI